MDTIRLTYAPYGFGRVQRVITPQQDGDTDTTDESGDELGFREERERKFAFKAEDDEI